MKSSAMIDELHYLGIDESDDRVLLLIPLLHVAWADAQVLAREEAIIRAAAKHLGLAEGDAGKLVSGWLAKRPSAEYLSRGLAALKELVTHQTGLGSDIAAQDLKFVLDSSKAVALAGSGMLGFLRYEPRSRAALEEVVAQLHLDDIEFELDPGWEYTEEYTGEVDPHSEEFAGKRFETTAATEEVPPGFAPGESGFAIGLEAFLEEPGSDPTAELLDLIRQTDFKQELTERHIQLIGTLLMKGDALPQYCSDHLIPLLDEAIAQLPLPQDAQLALRDITATNAVHRAGWDMAHSIRYGGAFSGSTVLRDTLVFRTTVYRQPATGLPGVLAGEGGYLKLLAQLSSVEGIQEHYALETPDSCTHFVHLFFCLEGTGTFRWLPVVVPLGDTPGKIVISPELLTEQEKTGTR